jgi:tRNA modification GTPase
MRTSFLSDDTICAVATAPGIGAIAVVRLSGPQSHDIVCRLFYQHGKPFQKERIEGYRAYYGQIVCNDDVLDEVVVTFLKAPHSFTGEDSVEISVHGSVFIQQRLLELLVEAGARMAMPGEFTRRAFVNRKFDLAQAEAVADIIASQNEAAHRLAMNQLKGGFSKELQVLRSKLLEITSLIELELDFSEEDVEFADRTQLKSLLGETQSHIAKLIASFRQGNAIKNGIPVAIVGETNTGKSTLLNSLLEEDRAIVSDIAGTTRDTIEEVMNLDGIMFRFIDTAGIRETDETIEKIGIERTLRKINEADIVLGLIDATKNVQAQRTAAQTIVEKVDQSHQTLLLLLNKTDLRHCERSEAIQPELFLAQSVLPISAKTGEGLDLLRKKLVEIGKKLMGTQNEVLVTNVRHFEALKHASESLSAVSKGLDDGIPTDLVAQDLREALYYLGSITGEITTDEVLGSIFGRFCIGK